MVTAFGFAQPVSSWMHLLGAAAFAVMGVMLLRRAKPFPQRRPYLYVYAVCCVLLLCVSGVFHSLPRGSEARRFMLQMDHAAIFTLIAATFTAIHGTLFRGWRRWGPLGIIWAAAVIGIVCKLAIFESASRWSWVAVYVVPTWLLAGFSSWLIARHYGAAFLTFPLWGGVAYTVGVAFNLSGLVVVPGVVGSHEIWHVFVLIGMGCFWKFIYDAASIPFADGAVSSAALEPATATQSS